MKTKDKFRLNKAAFMTEIGEQTQLEAINGKALAWFSDNSAIASVDANGLVTAMGDGDAVIRVESDSGQIAECMVSVGYHGQNPILPPTWGLFIADGEPHVFDGRMYICGSRDNMFGLDENGCREYCSSDYHMIYSDDLIHWTDSGVSISINDFPEELLFSEPTEDEINQASEKGEQAVPKAVKYLWAPDMFKSPTSEKYYLVFCSGQGHGEYFIAQADNPCGPFENIRRLTCGGKRMRGIDPGVLVDEDKKVYVALPAPFRIGELDPKKDYADVIPDSLISVQDLVASTSDGCYAVEGASLRKFGGLYYYIYIASRPNQRRPVLMKYLISENVRDGWRMGGDIIDTFEYLGAGNVHGSIEEFHGKMYLAYHRPAVGYNTAFTREMSMEEIVIGSDGLIAPAVMTSSGVRKAFEKGERISFASAVWFSGGRSDVRFTHRCTDDAVGGFKRRIEGSAYAWFDSVSQSNGYRYVKLNGCRSVTAAVRTVAQGAVVVFRNALSDEIIAKLSLPNTEGQWVEVTAELVSAGCEKCELTVELSVAPNSERVELDWFRFD